MKVRFSRRASRDLHAIARYIACDSAAAAEKIIDNIYRVCGLLAQNPGLGRLRLDVGQGVRYFPVSNLNIYYSVIRGEIVIVRVIHARRDLWRALYD